MFISKKISQLNLRNKTILTSVLVFFLSSTNIAFAGAGANIQACVYLNAVDTPKTYTFTAEGLQCMSSIGSTKPVTLQVSKAGITCASMGYVEQKDYDTGGDNCYGVNQGLWLLSYHDGGSHSGSTQTSWYDYSAGSNHLDLLENDPSTNLCRTQDKCSSVNAVWDRGTAPNLYVIFQPAAPSVSLKSNKKN